MKKALTISVCATTLIAIANVFGGCATSSSGGGNPEGGAGKGGAYGTGGFGTGGGGTGGGYGATGGGNVGGYGNTGNTGGSSYGGSGNTGNTGGSSFGGSGNVGGGGAGTGGAPPTINPACTVPTSAPSGGSCYPAVTTGTDASPGTCNPVTNAGCGTGEACDLAQDTMYHCFPPPNDAAICKPCDAANGPYCAGGYTCNASTTCARYCCTDADCGTGNTCTDLSATFGSMYKVCTQP